MQPFELLKRTPKSNCGQCGYPTCLAFAAAVSKGGAAPGKCPFLDWRGLELPQIQEAALDELPRQRELELVEHLKGKIAHLALAELAVPLGGQLTRDQDGETLTFLYLGQEARLNRDTILLDGESPADHRDQILIYNYIHGRGGSGPAGEWVGLESLPNTISKVKTLATYCEQPLAALFNAHPASAVLAAGTRLGGKAAADAADLGMIVPVLPRLEIYLLFWAAAPEEGFAAQSKALFDRRVLEVLDVESLVFAAERLAERLALLLNTGAA